MPRRIVITTGARLHFGLIALRDESARNFGGVGLMIDSPRFRLSTRVADADRVTADGAFRSRIETFVDTYRKSAPVAHPVPACELELIEAIPPHVGLGSGTQLGMTVAQALALLADDGTADVSTLAARVGRGKRSSIGIHGFDRGGFLIDGGKEQGTTIGRNVERLDFPAEWRIVLVTPERSEGLSGEPELDAFQRLPGMDAGTAGRLHRIIDERLRPAVQSADFDQFSGGLDEFGRIVGEYFAPVQGGVYADPRMAKLVDDLHAAGIHGVAQTSWGPTVSVLCRTDREAQSLVERIRSQPGASDASVQISAPLNTGSAIEVVEP